MMKVGLMGFGKVGQAVANVLANDPRYDLRWVIRQSAGKSSTLEDHPLGSWLDVLPVDAVVDFRKRLRCTITERPFDSVRLCW